MNRRTVMRFPRRIGGLGSGTVTGLALLLLLSCSINPATGEREFSLVSEADEIALGRQSDPEIVAQFGLYPDDDVQAYVARLGAELAAASERPDLPWTFRVLDDPLVNAFALPGGFIYVTRGIMTHLGSEAELVGVLGHEIGHVTARHGASQMSRAMLAQAGLGLGVILSPEVAGSLLGVAQTGLQLLFLKYGRDDERQADSLGLRYAARTGYDPNSLVEVFELLGRVSAASGSGAIPSWLSTHPAPENRTERLREQIAAAGLEEGALKVDRDLYLRRLDGMIFGDNPRHGFFREASFHHPDLAFQMEFPPGWSYVNSRQAVTAVSSGRDALVRLTLAEEESATAAARAFFAQQGVEQGGAWRQAIHGLSTASYGFAVVDQTGAERYSGLVAFVEHGDGVYQLLGYTVPERVSGYRQTFIDSVGSFRPLEDRRLLDVQPMRIRIERLDRRRTLEQLAPEADRSPVPIETLALLNDSEPDEVLPAGSLVKLVEGGVEQ